ncbi:MAG: hypothetical protein LBS05_05100 [Tannerellaceae bacterium]|jgi:hypothetical protein|nr:hypothetical protein [Tannerellaceae bacterium]
MEGEKILAEREEERSRKVKKRPKEALLPLAVHYNNIAADCIPLLYSVVLS